jgi:hypothetical protein
MERLREGFPEVKLVQFLNAAYFTKEEADASAAKAQIGRALLPGDELGLHIHGWKSLFEASGVTFRDEPTFWDENGVVTGCSFDDCGHEVPISAYETDELVKVIRFSNDVLEENGFGRPWSFRAGGWMARENVREALVLEGFVTENSAVPADFLASEIGDLPLHGWVDELWTGTKSTSQPFELETGVGTILEIPDNGALADYMTADEMVQVYEDCKAVYEDDPKHDVVVSIGFHQETAAKYVPRVEDALAKIFADAEENGIRVKVVTAEELALDIDEE